MHWTSEQFLGTTMQLASAGVDRYTSGQSVVGGGEVGVVTGESVNQKWQKDN